MGKFKATLRLPGDSQQALPATVQIQDGRMQVASGEHIIGDWEIKNIEIARIPEGFRIAAEGEVVLLDIEDRASFEQEAASPSIKSKGSSRPKKSIRRRAATGPESGPPTSKGVHAKSALSVEDKKPAKIKEESRLDRFLEWANARFGSTLLPSWVFTKGGLGAVLALIVVSVVFGQIVSYLLLIVGVIGLLTGGVTMLDSVIARRVLRHKVTPIQVVIGSGTVFVTGLLLGVVANQLWT